MSKRQESAGRPRGRPLLANTGQERRSVRVVATFTASQHAELLAAAQAQGIALATLVAQRATQNL